MGMQGVFGGAVDRIGGEPISARMARKAPMRHLDPTLLLMTLLLTTFGAVMIFSATSSNQESLGSDPAFFMKRQIIYALVGVIALLALALFDYRHLRAFTPVIYGVTLVTLVLVLTPLGDVRNGTQSWFDFGAFQIQPSEFAKIGVILALATYLAERKGDIRAVDVVVAVGIAGAVAGLVFIEPDLGGTMVLVAVLGIVLLVAGAKIRHFIALGFTGLLMVLVALQAGLIKDYQLERITAFLDPNPDLQTFGYSLIQAMIAIATGGMDGKGLGSENTQTDLQFVPEQHTDFIFTAVGEQLGFVGSAVLLGLFAMLIWRALRIAAMSRDLFGTLIAAGIAGMWGFPVFVNVGMTMGVTPITGLPLSFVSFGRSGLLTNFIAVGLLGKVHMWR